MSDHKQNVFLLNFILNLLLPHQAGLAARVKIWKPLKLEEELDFSDFERVEGMCAPL